MELLSSCFSRTTRKHSYCVIRLYSRSCPCWIRMASSLATIDAIRLVAISTVDGPIHHAFCILRFTSQKSSWQLTTKRIRSCSFATCMATVERETSSCTDASLARAKSISTRITILSKCCRTFLRRRTNFSHSVIASSPMKKTRKQRQDWSCSNNLASSTPTHSSRPSMPRLIQRISTCKVRSASQSKTISKWRAVSWSLSGMTSAQLWSRWSTARFWSENSQWTLHWITSIRWTRRHLRSRSQWSHQRTIRRQRAY